MGGPLSLRCELLNIHGHCHSLAYGHSIRNHVLQMLNQYIVFCEGVNKIIFTSFCIKNSSLPHPVLKKSCEQISCVCFMALFQ